MENNAKKVLIIDDDIGIANMIRAIFRIGNVDAAYASNGRQAFKLMETENLGMIICDIMMPDISGFDVLKHVRTHEHTKQLPFLFLSSLSSPADIKRGIDAGADKYITKPFTARELLDIIKEFMTEPEA
ncbi:MAG: response regulator [Chitinophagales bacterium]|nr:response regulator [Chitinophagaceae bacterium]MCB9066157.1 response regulator [Chitinophagales bacterium]